MSDDEKKTSEFFRGYCSDYFPESSIGRKDDKQLADRANKGKPQYSLLDLECFKSCVRVLEFGAKKYARDNWKKGQPFSQLLDSTIRHIARLSAGEYYDAESGLPHTGHIMCNLMFMEHESTILDLKFEDKE